MIQAKAKVNFVSLAVHLCAENDLPEGQARGYAELGIFVLRHAGRLHAYRDACPHYGDTPLAWRRDAYLNADASRIVCAAHGAQFDPATGVCLLGPCLGQALSRVPVMVADDGRIAALLTDPQKNQETSS